MCGYRAHSYLCLWSAGISARSFRGFSLFLPQKILTSAQPKNRSSSSTIFHISSWFQSLRLPLFELKNFQTVLQSVPLFHFVTPKMEWNTAAFVLAV